MPAGTASRPPAGAEASRAIAAVDGGSGEHAGRPGRSAVRIGRALRWLERHGEEAIAGACLAVLSTLIFVQVIMRYVFRSPLSWSDEVAVYCMIGLVYFGAAFAVRERAHIRVLLVFSVLPRPAATGVAAAADALWFAFNSLMLWKGIELTLTYVQQPSYSAALEINLLWPTLLIPLGYGLMCLRMLQAYAGWRAGGPSPFEPTG